MEISIIIRSIITESLSDFFSLRIRINNLFIFSQFYRVDLQVKKLKGLEGAKVMSYDQMVERIIISYDFHSKKEYDEYMDAHPKADKSNHKVVDLSADKDKKDTKVESIRKKVEKYTPKGKGEGSLEVKISGSCDMVKSLLSAISGKSTRLEESKSGRCTGHINLNDKEAEKFLASVRGR